MTAETKFFTNEDNDSLFRRFSDTFSSTRYLDILVGYFRISGFHMLKEALKDIEKVRILIGLELDKKSYDCYILANQQNPIPIESAKTTKDEINNLIVLEMEYSEENSNIEKGIRDFIQFIKDRRIEIKAHPSRDIHAKVYIHRYKPEVAKIAYGSVITGSSNFSYRGLQAAREFNVELKDPADVNFALEKFEKLWNESIDVTEDYVTSLEHNTWINDFISPHDLYLKFLYEYFKEDLSSIDVNLYMPRGYKELEYQKQAIINAKKILESYGGVFLVDVVGLGKTSISAMLAQQLIGGILVLCPPVLVSYWRETFSEFNLRNFIVESYGNLDKVIKDGVASFSYVFIDEAHRFRNDNTDMFSKLFLITRNKQIVLVGATPMNNKIEDIENQLRLFQDMSASTIPAIPLLEEFFKSLNRRLNRHVKYSKAYTDEFRTISKEIRDKVLKYVMVRRTRSEIINYFSNDIKQQGLTFPTIQTPNKIIYTFDRSTSNNFNCTLKLIESLKYARYKPLTYLKTPLSQFEEQQQKNLAGFMKSLLLKRLESSFYAFRMTVSRYIDSYENFLKQFKDGYVLLNKKLQNMCIDSLDDALAVISFYNFSDDDVIDSAEFNLDLISDIEVDLDVLKEIAAIWKSQKVDPKLDKLIECIKTDKLLQNKIILFTESKETGEYLYDNLSRLYKDKVFFYSSESGAYEGKTHNHLISREIIRSEFDPNSPTPSDIIQYLITTDILAEGMNLHRSNVIVNYDLPWNPTKVLQRVGRINRVGSTHKQLYVYNFFPTEETDQHLPLEKNIVNKIQAFHDILGEDAKYLSDKEEVSTHNLFGEELYKKLSDKSSYEAEDDTESELKYLEIIRKIKDEEPEKFARIKRIPKKARTSRILEDNKGKLLTFFRIKRLKKFYISDGNITSELPFLDAAKLMACEAKAVKSALSPNFYNIQTKNYLKLVTDITDSSELTTQKSSSTANKILKALESNNIIYSEELIEDDKNYIAKVAESIRRGALPKKVISSVNKEFSNFKSAADILNIPSILRKCIDDTLLIAKKQNDNDGYNNAEVVLSEYFSGE